jgi:urease beta subunit
MTIQTFTAGQTLTATQMNTLQASDFNFTRNVQTGASYTLVETDRGKLLEFSNAGLINLTIPTNASVPFEIGDRVDVLLTSTGSLEIAGASGVTVASEGGALTISSQWTRVTLIKRTTNDWVITGGAGEVQTAEIEDGAITEAKLASNSVTSAKILDGTIVNTDINATAAIAYSKLNLGTSIVNADISTSAAIAHTKLANATAGQVLLGTTTTGVVTATTVSGDVTITGAGVTAIGSGVIVDADISASAAISLSKLATGALPTAITVTSANISDLSIVNADISTSAAIDLSKLATGALPTAITVASANIVDGTIVNDDVSASAAIAHTK